MLGAAALILVGVAGGLAVGVGADRAPTADANTFSEDFERGTIRPGLTAVGRPKVQSRVRRSGKRALMTPRQRGRHSVVRTIRAARQVRVDVSYRRTRGGSHGIVRFDVNRVELNDDGRRLVLSVRGKRRVVGSSRRSVGRWTQIALVLDGAGKRVIVGRNRRKIASLKMTVRLERRVRIGTRSGHFGPAYYDSLRVLRGEVAKPSTTPISSPGGSSPGSSSGGAPSGARLFGPSSIWNAPLPATAAIDPNSAAIVANLVDQSQRYLPWINSEEYSVPIYEVGPGYRRVTVRLANQYQEPAVLDAFRAVPVPPNARPAAGTDQHLVVWQPSTDTMWEFFDMQGSGDSWSAQAGARIDGVSTHPGAVPWPLGASGSGIPIAGGLMLLDELAAGRIDHALALAVRDARTEYFTFPANRTDGNLNDPAAVPEGAHLRLDPSLDLDALNLPRPTRILAEAAQRYGMIVRDKSAGLTLYAEDSTPSGRSAVLDSFLGGMSPGAVLRAFPWSHLQVIKMDLRCCWISPNSR